MAAKSEHVEKLALCLREIVTQRGTPPAEFGALIERLGATSEDLAGVLAHVANTTGGPVFEKERAMIEAHLLIATTGEHVRAQEKMSHSAGFLAAVGVFLAIVGIFASCSQSS